MNGVSRAASVVARTEFRRTVRVVAGDRTKLLVLGAVALFMLGPVSVFGVLGLSAAGEAVAAGGVGDLGFATPTEIVTGGAAVLWVGVAVMATIRTTTAVADVEKPACLLISTPLRNAVVGLVGAEIALFGAWIAVPTLLLSGAFAYGAGTALPVPAAVAVVAVLLVTAVPVGFVVGVWIRHLLTVYEPVARFRTVIGVLAFAVYMGLIATGWFNRITSVVFSVLGDSPLGWPGHLLLVGVPTIDPSPVAAVGALVGTVLFVPVALAAGVASARVHWYADPARTEGGGSGDETATSREPVERAPGRLESALVPTVGRPAWTVAATALRRTKRAPVRLLYVAYPLFGVFPLAQTVYSTGTFPSYLAVLLSLYVVWAAGAFATLNPLGDLGPALPAAMTSTVSGRASTRGLILAGAGVTAPIGLLVALAAGVASPLPVERTLLLVAGTVVGAVLSPALATGVGTAFPRFGSVKVTNNREAVMPSKAAFLCYSLAIALPAAAAAVIAIDAAALLADVLTALLAFLPVIGEPTVPAGLITALAWLVLVVGLVAPLAGYRYAVARFDGYRIE
ncbi:hypothetical protein [Saliphagus infecundisoli]|uniref:ABC-2 type transport system permease protein n=1 Tax=Saliphagus infecundisoli TaxID=1849069 RepID=A0ABD5QGK9_9EURY|nr:hypothetical protein [Saliphagus infecundisoli]